MSRVSITEAGDGLLRESREAKTAYLAARIERLSSQEQTQLQAALPILEKLLEDVE